MMTAIRITNANSVDAIMQIVIMPFIMGSSIIGMAIAPFQGLFFILVVIPPLSRTHPHHAAATDEHKNGKRNQ